MRFIVRTTLDRKLHDSYHQINFDLSIDYSHSPVLSFINLLKEIDDPVVILEDDLILCRNFEVYINNTIKLYPDFIINYFEDPHTYYSTHFKIDFAWNQCTYYPKGIAKLIGLEMERLLLDNVNIAYDILERKALKSLSLKYLVYRPCIVQHIDSDSLIQPRPLKRRTPFFVDYLSELDINYDDAYKSDKLDKLVLKLKTSFPN